MSSSNIFSVSEKVLSRFDSETAHEDVAVPSNFFRWSGVDRPLSLSWPAAALAALAASASTRFLALALMQGLFLDTVLVVFWSLLHTLTMTTMSLTIVNIHGVGIGFIFDGFFLQKVQVSF